MKNSLSESNRICKSADLEPNGTGVRFTVLAGGREFEAFAVRRHTTPYAYLNQCPHLFLELDWEPGEFFDEDCDFIICANHGAMFEPAYRKMR